jgi:hypothetical protein
MCNARLKVNLAQGTTRTTPTTPPRRTASRWFPSPSDFAINNGIEEIAIVRATPRDIKVCILSAEALAMTSKTATLEFKLCFGVGN